MCIYLYTQKLSKKLLVKSNFHLIANHTTTLPYYHTQKAQNTYTVTNIKEKITVSEI